MCTETNQVLVATEMDLKGPKGALWDPRGLMGPKGALWDPKGPNGTQRGLMGLKGDPKGPYGTQRGLMGPAFVQTIVMLIL